MRKREVPVKDIETGETWRSVTAAAATLGVAIPTITQAIRLHRPCKGRWLAYDVETRYCDCCGKAGRQILRPNYGLAA